MCKFVTLDIVNTKKCDFSMKSKMSEDVIHRAIFPISGLEDTTGKDEQHFLRQSDWTHPF